MMKSVSQTKNRVSFFFEKKIKVKIFLINGYKYEGFISALIDEYQFGFEDYKKGEDILEYKDISGIVKSYG